MSIVRTALSGLAGVVLVGLGFWSIGDGRVQAPGMVTAPSVWRVSHLGDGVVRWQVLDGTLPGGSAVAADGVLIGDRGDQLTLTLREGLDEGTEVSAGQPLVDTDRPALREAAKERTAKLAAIRADAAALEKGGRVGAISAAQAEVRVARANLERARRARDIAQSTAAQGGIGKWEAELAELEVTVQMSALAAAEGAVARARDLPLEEEINAAAARTTAAIAAEAEARIRAFGEPLSAPFDGRVRRPGGDIIIEVESTQDSLVQVLLPEVQRNVWAPGEQVHFWPTDGGDALPGTLLRIGTSTALGASGPLVWAVVQLEALAPAGSTGVLRKADAIKIPGVW